MEISRSHLPPAAMRELAVFAEFLGVSAGVSPQLNIQLEIDGDTGLKKQSRNDSVTVRSRPFGKCYSYLKDMCYETLLRIAGGTKCFGKAHF